MKRYISLIAVALAAAMLLCGCSNWLEGTYQSITPHQHKDMQTMQEHVQIATYGDMRRSLERAVESGAMGGSIGFRGVNGETVKEYMAVAFRYLKMKNAVYAYAVKDVTFELTEKEDETVIAYQITYHHGRSEVLKIQQVETMNDASDVVCTALDRISDQAVLMTDHYSPTDFKQVIRSYAEQNPGMVMEIPEINVRVYPDSGAKRVIALDFTYQTDREQLAKMRQETEQVFLSADLYIKGATQVREIYSRLYSFIMERYDYKLEASVTPTYSLLLDGVGDSRAFANVYAAMCKNAGLTCSVIHGSKNGVAWSWTLVRIRDTYYHVDLLECEKNGQFEMLTSAEMEGYTWDTGSYTVS